MKILVSGFVPFGGEKMNPTQSLVTAIAESPAEFMDPSLGSLRGISLPVTLEDAFAHLSHEIDTFRPDVVLSLGQAGGRARIEIERVAINCLDFDIPDNSGAQPRDRRIDDQGPDAFFTTLPVRRLLSRLDAERIPCGISNSAGTYVCNFLFYRLQEKTRLSLCRSGFVHVPFLPNQVVDRPGVASMELETMKRALRAMILGLL